MNKLASFLHLVKHSGHLKLGADYVTTNNASRIKLVLLSEAISALSRESVYKTLISENINYLDVPANIFTEVYPGKSVKVIAVLNTNVASKIANLMKEGASYE